MNNIQQYFQYHHTSLKWFVFKIFYQCGQMHKLFSFHQCDPDSFQHISVNAGHTVPWNDKGGQTLANSHHQIISISILLIEFLGNWQFWTEREIDRAARWLFNVHLFIYFLISHFLSSQEKRSCLKNMVVQMAPLMNTGPLNIFGHTVNFESWMGHNVQRLIIVKVFLERGG